MLLFDFVALALGMFWPVSHFLLDRFSVVENPVLLDCLSFWEHKDAGANVGPMNLLQAADENCLCCVQGREATSKSTRILTLFYFSGLVNHCFKTILLGSIDLAIFSYFSKTSNFSSCLLW